MMYSSQWRWYGLLACPTDAALERRVADCPLVSPADSAARGVEAAAARGASGKGRRSGSTKAVNTAQADPRRGRGQEERTGHGWRPWSRHRGTRSAVTSSCRGSTEEVLGEDQRREDSASSKGRPTSRKPVLLLFLLCAPAQREQRPPLVLLAARRGAGGRARRRPLRRTNPGGLPRRVVGVVRAASRGQPNLPARR